MSVESVVRTNYFDRQFLRPQDFTDEQAYHIGMRRRHNIAHHRWGIVFGLQLVIDDKTSIFLQPGMAIDGYGREVIVGDRMSVPHAAFDKNHADVLDVWLLYDREGSDLPPSGYAGCSNSTAGDVNYYRWREGAQLFLTRADPNPEADRRKPERVPAGDQAFAPNRTPPDEPKKMWPIFIGQVTRVPGSPESFTVNLDNRPYAGLVGEQVTSPDGTARVQVGSERKDDTIRFAVFLDEPSDDSGDDTSSEFLPCCPDDTSSTQEADSGKKPKPPVMQIDDQGKVAIRHDTTFMGNAIMHNGSLEIKADSRKQKMAKEWSVYHVGPDKDALEELRIEMPASGNAQVSIGVWSEDDKKFHPCLTVKNTCEVIVAGDLKVQGELTDRHGSVPTNEFTARAMVLLLSAFQQGIAGAPFSAGGGAGGAAGGSSGAITPN